MLEWAMSHPSFRRTRSAGPDYLLQFVDPRSISENAMGQGFAPGEAKGGG